jgi:hypothetical protein
VLNGIVGVAAVVNSGRTTRRLSCHAKSVSPGSNVVAAHAPTSAMFNAQFGAQKCARRVMVSTVTDMIYCYMSVVRNILPHNSSSVEEPSSVGS